MKTFILLLITTFTLTNISAQNSNDYIEEAYSLFKIKSFNPSSDTKRCEILAYVRVADKFKNVSFYIELLPNKQDPAIFRDILDFKDLSTMVVAKAHRQNGSVYELNFGTFNISEYANMQMIINYNDGSTTTLPLEMTNYKNPITIMN